MGGRERLVRTAALALTALFGFEGCSNYAKTISIPGGNKAMTAHVDNPSGYSYGISVVKGPWGDLALTTETRQNPGPGQHNLSWSLVLADSNGKLTPVNLDSDLPTDLQKALANLTRRQ